MSGILIEPVAEALQILLRHVLVQQKGEPFGGLPRARTFIAVAHIAAPIRPAQTINKDG
jgi:hypothetical protein